VAVPADSAVAVTRVDSEVVAVVTCLPVAEVDIAAEVVADTAAVAVAATGITKKESECGADLAGPPCLNLKVPEKENPVLADGVCFIAGGFLFT
jgi:hypothetical protein